MKREKNVKHSLLPMVDFEIQHRLVDCEIVFVRFLRGELKEETDSYKKWFLTHDALKI